ncbi:MAG: hypothetical protein QOJ86_1929 [Bradyrhizobium sp.]|jgi:hypothetical protein|nr:hypothetical protein [Bradyrhizobium sp.]
MGEPSQNVQDLKDQPPPPDVLAFRNNLRAELSLALPFPDFDWSNENEQKQNTEKLRFYVESAALSSIEWYLRKIVWKRIFARTLHVLTILAAAIAASIELLNIATVLDSSWVKDLLSPSPGASPASRAAELTLLFAGIAGGFKIIDHVAGNTSDWMRFRVTASAINTVLANFRFEWMELDRTLPLQSGPGSTTKRDYPATEPAVPAVDLPDKGVAAPLSPPEPPAEAPPTRGKTRAKDPNTDPVQERVKLARRCWNKISGLVERETAIWAEELKKRMEPPVVIHPPAKEKRDE